MRQLGFTAITLIMALSTLTAACRAQTQAASAAAPGKEPTVHHATGSFEVKLTPQISDPPVGRMTIEKTYHGGLDGTSKGEMLATGSGAKGSSGGYVALEQFTGALDGRKGSFVLQHSGTLDHGAQQLTITVVPDSGTGELAGLAGTFHLTIAEGKHMYDLQYTLPATK